VKRYDVYIFDLDGTLYRGEESIEHAPEVVRELKRSGASIRYLTNNSSRTQAFFAEKLGRMGFPVTAQDVYSSATGTVKYLAERELRRVFLVGEDGLHETLRLGGVTLVDRAGPADAVVAGICLSFTYDWMNEAMQLIRAGAAFVATNADGTFPLERGALAPGAGSIVAALRTCSEREPFVVGKPNPFLIELILHEGGFPKERALCVGDRLDTDIESGKSAGCDTFLVMTGVESRAPDGQAWGEDLRSLL
jgi:4-nitrophenyl phosphatase